MRAVSLGAPALAGTIAALALLGWGLDVPSLRGNFELWVGMNPLTAVLLMVLSVAVASMSRGRGSLARPAAALIVVLGVLGLMRMAGVDLSLDLLLFRSRVGPTANRMAPNSALCFVLMGVGVLTFPRRDRWSARLFAAGGALAGLALFGYLYRAASLTQVTTFIPMTANTAVALLLLALAGLVENQHHPFIERLRADDLSGMVSRRLIGPIVLVPLLAGWVRFMAEEAGLLSPHTAVALMAVFTIALLVALASVTSGIIHRMEVERALHAAGRERMIVDLQGALDRGQVEARPPAEGLPRGILTVCSGCKKVPEDGGWRPLEVVMNRLFGVRFSHGICPECTKVLYPEYHERKVKEAKERSQTPP
jgi:hypothetical protein